MAENFETQNKEVENTKINKQNPNPTPAHPPRHRIIKLLKTKVKQYKEKILRHPGGKRHIAYRGKRVRITIDFLSETTQTRKQ